uniref:C-X-C motif chemokine 11-like protein n=1 Tax=Agkistrodon contortrix contortrix TaxID=8713 RepID=A0A1W7RII1_AGKCO
MLKQAFLAVLLLLACCVALMQGLPTSSRERCLCKRPGMLSVRMDRVATVEYHQSSGSCGREELLVTLKNSRRRCLNLNGEQGRTIKEAIMKKRNVK